MLCVCPCVFARNRKYIEFFLLLFLFIPRIVDLKGGKRQSVKRPAQVGFLR
uniref:Uncharacterized protein n=1 Tax=Octopus bimaculoides TaxID=37653 RepID=A0A0L8FJH9_OCTBM